MYRNIILYIAPSVNGLRDRAKRQVQGVRALRHNVARIWHTYALHYADQSLVAWQPKVE